MTIESFLCAKDGSPGPCGDRLVDTPHFKAVIDGATPKGQLLWEGKRGDVFVAEIIAKAIESLDPKIDAPRALEEINLAIRRAYTRHGREYRLLPPEERLQASLLLYSAARKEVWCFGDCMLRINDQEYRHPKKGDQMLADLRAFCLEAARLAGSDPDPQGKDLGREQILPFLRSYPLFANSDASFGYDVLNGGPIRPQHAAVYPLRPGDRVILSSDGYPRLFETLEETENHLKEALGRDPACTGE
ncbi:MAG: hypothetical protein J6H18_01110, partial [Lachnospiraceae bacterium]|nr:hypothetical protein [Lachnospiraceae bacterium]